MEKVQLDPATWAYVDTRVTRGFPMGGIGSGGFSLNTDGSFGEVRFNNNWMCPFRSLRGCFHALFTRRHNIRQTLLLRRAASDSESEYEGARNVRSTVFTGALPSFALHYGDDLPVRVTLHGFTPHVPHDVRTSTLPAAVFRFCIENPGDEAAEAAILFSFENVLGRGGTGHLGVELGEENEIRGVRQRVVYDSVAGNHQREAVLERSRGIRFLTEQHYDPRSHRSGVTGEYLLLVRRDPELDVTVCDGWNAAARSASVLDDFSRNGRTRSRESGRRGDDSEYRPAAAVAAATVLAPRESREIVFALAWWTASHVTEPALSLGQPGAAHDGARAGHVYENHFDGIDDVAEHVLGRVGGLESASTELNRMLERSSLPHWLVRTIANSIDSVLCNTVVPATGRLYTLEGVDWHWPMGGLTGTNDQRLSAHPYTSVFFTDLDLSELDEFRRLADGRGAIPHGNGNCDLGLGTTDVPYGWPMFIKDFLPAKEWTDLTMSLVLQVGKLWRTTGRREILDRFWPALVRGMEYLHGLAPTGVPGGGTTYDVWDFPGAFIYTATLYLASLRMMADLAAAAEPDRIGVYRQRYEACSDRIDRSLWDERGFFRTCETVDTIFTAALAGDWIARYAGLDPVVDAKRAASHLQHQQRVLIDAALQAAGHRYRAMPRAEARFDGAPVPHPMAAGLPEGEEMTYVWQVLSYQAMEQIYLGQVAAGLQTIRCIYDRVWHDGNAWSGGLRGNGESIYMTHPVIWAVLNALTGAALDVPGRTLHLSPRTGGEIDYLRCPFFFPSFWATLDHDPHSGKSTVEVRRCFGSPVSIDRVQQRFASGHVRTIEMRSTELATGTILELDLGSIEDREP